ncbi:hypothetical protein A7U60_g5281 [Sanghuangporus baumii]|uniref:DUF6534 domain-containing protein n=1 Tax=Sanghuangporus baumii TaxID=108892 RepID=A0A9Q5HX12_SANBA|nr:hypothetical protein A7U60_g5281 [Sanghuangporus baumii]
MNFIIMLAGAHNKGHSIALVIAIISISSFGAGIAGCYELFMKDRLMANLVLPTLKYADLTVIQDEIAQIAHMVAYLAWPQKTYWIPFHLAMSKLHVLTLLAMLNSRFTLRARSRSHEDIYKDSSPGNEADVKAVDREPPLTPDSMELNKIRMNQSSTIYNDPSHANGVEIIDIVKSPFTA